MNLEKKLSKDFEWSMIPARKEYKKGRAKGGFLMGIRKDWGYGSVKVGIRINEDLINSEIIEKGEKNNCNFSI